MIVVRVTLALTYDHETSSVVYLAISNMPTIYDHSASNSIISIFKLLTDKDSDF